MKLLLFLTSLLFASSVSVYAQSSSDIMLDMIDFITERTDYVYNGERLPYVELKSIDEMCRTVYTQEILDSIGGVENCAVLAYYDNTIDAIYISDTVPEDIPAEGFYEMILLHELVHYLQDINGAYGEVRCLGELERDAYKMQEEYVEFMGYPEEHIPNALFVFMVSTCDIDRY